VYARADDPGHASLSQAVSSLLDMMDDYRGHATQLRATGGDRTSDPGFQRSVEHLKVILSRLSGRPLNGVIAAIDQLYDDARHDEELRAWWADVDAYVRKSLLEPGYIVDEDCAREGKALRDRSDVFFKDKVSSSRRPASRAHASLIDCTRRLPSTPPTRIACLTRCSSGSRASAKVRWLPASLPVELLIPDSHLTIPRASRRRPSQRSARRRRPAARQGPPV
jgi:hypothetical protein